MSEQGPVAVHDIGELRGEPAPSPIQVALDGGVQGLADAADDRSRGHDPRHMHRVRLSHAQSRTTITVALLFLVAAAVAAVAHPSTWLALHLFLAGAVTLTVSAVSLMLTVTWAAAPAPADRPVAVQRWAVAVGAAGVAVAREVDELPEWSIGIPGAVFVVGLVLLIVLLLTTARRGRERRFDVAVGFYVAALVAALAAVGVGIHMASAGATTQLRSIHVVLNLLGFVGLTVAGSLPFFAATVGRSRMAPAATPRRLAILLGAMVLTLGVTVGGLAMRSEGLVFSGLGGYLYGIIAVFCFLPRPDRRQLLWSGPRLVALWTGGLWWMGAVGAMAYGVIADHHDVLIDRWMHVLVVGGFAQILWGSLAYLIPMLRGGGQEKLREGFARTRSWVGFAGLNAAAVALALDEPGLGTAFLAVAVVDGAWRIARVGLRRVVRPGEGARTATAPVDPGPA